ncbi:MAG: hypothetical protein HOP19_12945 [Acidobacteria bacterium]|nr:hypothetical protein [Acidobacteriota bacterium]
MKLLWIEACGAAKGFNVLAVLFRRTASRSGIALFRLSGSNYGYAVFSFVLCACA